MTTYNIHIRQTYFTPASFETAILAKERQQTNALDRMATGMGLGYLITVQISLFNARST
jgi:hypothetical protein